MASLALLSYVFLRRIKIMLHCHSSGIPFQETTGNIIPSWTFPSAYKDLDPAPETHLSSKAELLCIQSDTVPFGSLSATCLRWPYIWKSPLLDIIYSKEYAVLIWGKAWRNEWKNTLKKLFPKSTQINRTPDTSLAIKRHTVKRIHLSATLHSDSSTG